MECQTNVLPTSSTHNIGNYVILSWLCQISILTLILFLLMILDSTAKTYILHNKIMHILCVYGNFIQITDKMVNVLILLSVVNKIM